MKIVTNISGNTSNANFNGAAQQVTIGDFSNPNFVRGVQLTNAGVVIYRPGITVGFQILDLIQAAVTAEPNLTWKPIISLQPSNVTVNAPNAANFQIAASCESFVTLGYQWQISNDSGGNWANQANGGVYSGATSNTLSISNSTSLNGKYYRCVPYNVAGSTNSNAAVLTVN